MSKDVEIILSVTVTDDTDPKAAAEQVFDLIGQEAPDLAPLIETVTNWEARQVW